MLNRKRKLLIMAGAVVMAGALGGGAVALNRSDSDVPITGDALERAEKAALDHTNGGRVTETEVGDEEGYYEVEVTLDSGRQLDVHMDESFNVVGEEADDDHEDKSNQNEDD